MSKTLRTLGMKFGTGDGKSVTITLPHCRADISAGEAQAAMDTILDSGIFLFDPTDGVGAQVVERTVTQLF